MSTPYLQRGFSLIEMAIVMLVIGLLVGGLLAPLNAQIDQQRTNETQKSLAEIKEALVSFAVVNGRLPCPAISAASGAEMAACPAASREGYIPWATLGVSKLDAWGHIFRYSVTPAYASSVLALSTVADITIQTRDATGATVPLSNGIPAVVLSHGKNGYSSANDLGTPLPLVPAATNPDENTNAPPNTIIFVSRTPTPIGYDPLKGGEFDDIVVWISPNILFSRMVAAGRLP